MELVAEKDEGLYPDGVRNSRWVPEKSTQLAQRDGGQGSRSMMELGETRAVWTRQGR